jgi:hypothetical protein
MCLTIVATTLLSSCNLQERIDARGEPTPRRLDSTPETTGLLVIDVHLRVRDILGLETHVRVDEGTIRRTDTREPIRQGSLRMKLVLLQLPPGNYELASVRGMHSIVTPQQVFWQTVEPFLPSEVGPIAVAAGQITYVGKLTATRYGARGLSYAYQWDRDPAREAEALAMVEKEYGDSLWIPILRNRLDSLRREPAPGTQSGAKS